MNKIYPYERRVYYYETDKMGIVHHSNYIRIFEEARMHFLKQMGMRFDKLEELGFYVPILSVECQYKKPLVYNEPFSVYSTLTEFKGARITVTYEVFSRRTGELCITGSTVQCFTDKELRPVRIKNKCPELYSLFSEYVGYKVMD